MVQSGSTVNPSKMPNVSTSKDETSSNSNSSVKTNVQEPAAPTPAPVKPSFGTLSPGVSFKNIVTLNTPAAQVKPQAPAVKQTPINSTPQTAPNAVKFGTLNASLPLRVQSAPPSMIEESQTENVKPVQKPLEPAPESTSIQFTAQEVNKTTEEHANTAPTAPNVRKYQAQHSGYPYHQPSGPYGAYYHPNAQYYNYQNYGSAHSNYVPPMYQGGYGAYIPYQSTHYQNHKVGGHHVPYHHSSQESKTSEHTSIPLVVPVEPRPSKKIQLVNPETGEQVDLESLAKQKKSVEENKPVLYTEKPLSPAINESKSEVKIESATPSSRKPLILVDPVSNKPVDIEVLAGKKEAEKIAELIAEFQEEDEFISSEEEDEAEEEEEEVAVLPEGINFPIILARGMKVRYPADAIRFDYPPEGEPFRYTADFMRQFESLCKGVAMDIGSFPKVIPVIKATRRGGRGGDRERSGRGPRGSKVPHQYTQEQLTLHNRAECAWKISKAMVLEEDAVLVREVKQLLNKMAEDNFELISEKIINLELIKAATALPALIDLFFDKSVEEPRYAPLYARLCYKICCHEYAEKKALMESVPEDQQVKPTSHFRLLLVSKCQEEYNAKKAYSRARLERLKAKELAAVGLSEEDIRAAIQEGRTPNTGELTEEDYVLIKTKRRVLGNMKFIGELFVIGVISAKVMDSVIRELLSNYKNPEEEEVESLCKLIVTVGPLYEKSQFGAHMAQHISHMKILSQNQTLSTRVRFMVEDTLELHSNGWTRKVARPAPTSTPSPLYQTSRRPSDRNDRRAIGDVRNERRGSDKDSFVASEKRVTIKVRTKSEEQHVTTQHSKSQEISTNRYDILEESSVSSASSPLETQPVFDEKVLSKLSAVFDETLTQKNFEDCLLIFSSIPTSHRSQGLSSLILFAMDKGRKHVNGLIENILPLLVADESLLTKDDIETALSSSFELIDDLCVDIPNAYEFAGQFCAFFVDHGKIDFGKLEETILAPVLSRDPTVAAKILLYTLHKSGKDVEFKKALIASDSSLLTTSKDSLESLIKKLEMTDFFA